MVLEDIIFILTECNTEIGSGTPGEVYRDTRDHFFVSINESQMNMNGYLKVGFKVCQDYVGAYISLILDTRGVGLRRIYNEGS